MRWQPSQYGQRPAAERRSVRQPEDRVTTTVYGVSEDLDLSFLEGASLEQVRLGQFDIQFHFHPRGEIGVQGEIAAIR